LQGKVNPIPFPQQLRGRAADKAQDVMAAPRAIVAGEMEAEVAAAQQANGAETGLTGASWQARTPKVSLPLSGYSRPKPVRSTWDSRSLDSNSITHQLLAGGCYTKSQGAWGQVFSFHTCLICTNMY